MVNSQALRRELQVAARNHDSNAMVQVVKVAFTPNTKKGMKPQIHKQVTLMVNDADYAGLLAALLDAHAAAEAVSEGFFFSFLRFIQNGSFGRIIHGQI